MVPLLGAVNNVLQTRGLCLPPALPHPRSFHPLSTLLHYAPSQTPGRLAASTNTWGAHLPPAAGITGWDIAPLAGVGEAGQAA